MGRFSFSKLLMLATMAGLCAVNPAFGTALLDDAQMQVNFTDFQFSDAATDDDVDVGLIGIVTGSNFEIVEFQETGDADADMAGSAQACNIAECGLVSIFPLAISADAVSSGGLADATGLAEGELTFTNNSGMDLVFVVFLESDVFWENLEIDDPLSEFATLGWETGFQYGDVSDSPHSNLLEGIVGGLQTEDFCPGDIPNACSARVALGPFPLADGETQTFRGFALLAATVSSGPLTVPEPGTLSLLWLLPPLIVRTFRSG